jgi:hypothetical protein
MGTHPLKLAVCSNCEPQNPATIYGVHTAMDFFRRQLLHEWQFTWDRVVERRVNSGKRIIDHGMDLALQIVRGFRRFEIERTFKLIVK